MKLTEPRRACLDYYRRNETNSSRVVGPYEKWDRRQLDWALDNELLIVGPKGWHVLSEAGIKALEQSE